MINQYHKRLREALDKHAEYYIAQTVKFFQEDGESPALSKDNDGDLKAQAAIDQAVFELVMALLPAIDVEAYPDEQWRYNGEPRGELDLTYRILQAIKPLGGGDA